MGIEEMTEAERIARLMGAWDEMDRRAQNVLTALPSQMTAAALKLDAARLAMRHELQDFTRRSAALRDRENRDEG